MMKPATRLAVLLLCAGALSGCGTLNLANTIAGGACGAVTYRVFVAGISAGVEGGRECVPDQVETRTTTTETTTEGP